MKLAPLVLCTLVALATRATAQEESVARFTLATQASQGVLALELSEAVVRPAADPDLADLRVFNARGEALSLGRLATAQDTAAQQSATAIELRLVPLAKEEPARDRSLRELSLRVAQDGMDARIELTPAATTGAQDASAEPGAYLLDLRPAERAAGTLALEFAADAPDYARRIEILGSEDLVAWHALASGPLTRNRQLDTPVDEHEFAIGSAPSFARIQWPRGEAPRLTGARFTPPRSAAPLPRVSLGVVRGEEPDTCYADVPIALQIERIHIRASTPNTSLRVRIDRRDDSPPEARSRRRSRRPFDPWIPVRGELDVYRVERAGVQIESEPFPFPYRTTRLRIRTLAGEAFGDTLPVVEAQWRPPRYVVLAREPGPYVLQVGDAQAAPGPVLDAASMVASDDPYGLQLPAAHIETADVRTSANDAGETTPTLRDPRASRIVLWGILALAVAALGAMALRLATQLRAQGTTPRSRAAEHTDSDPHDPPR
jgi:hypothetical protein